MSVLEMRRVSRTYGVGAAEVHALQHIDLTVDAGVMVAVMGPSGSGKSTLLTIAGSLEEASSGEVWVCGEELTKLSRNAKARLRRRSIGYVFQDFNLLPGLTAAENVSLPLELDGMSARKARVAGLKSLDELGLGDRAEHFPDQLSGGELMSDGVRSHSVSSCAPAAVIRKPFCGPSWPSPSDSTSPSRSSRCSVV